MLLSPLARAQHALTRLQATSAAASAGIREGLWARLAFREASGWLAHQGHWIHPLDLALREAGLTGSYAAARLGERLPSVLPATTGAVDIIHDVPEDQEVTIALTLGRLWRRLAESRSWRPLHDPENLAATLAPLGEGNPAAALAEWQRFEVAHDLPALILAGLAARDWEQTGRRDRLSLCGLFLAACIWQGEGEVALPLWSAPAQRLHRLALQPRAGWLPLFLEIAAEAATLASQELARLQRAEARAAGLAHTVRSRLPAAAMVALRRPVITARLLADSLAVSHRAALNLIRELETAKVIRETTGRLAWRAFAVV